MKIEVVPEQSINDCLLVLIIYITQSVMMRVAAALLINYTTAGLEMTEWYCLLRLSAAPQRF